MKSLCSLNRVSASVVLALLLSTAGTHAVSLLTWDPGHTGTNSDGAGEWLSGNPANWASGGADSAWVQWSDASIGTAAGAANYDITVKLAVNVGNITFNQMTSPGKYSILASPAPLTIGGTVTCNNVGSGSSSTTYMGKGQIVSSNTFGYVTFTKDGTGTLRLSSATLVTTANPAVEIKNGIMQIAGFDNNLPTAGVLQVDSNGIFDLTGVNQTIAGLTGSGSAKNSTGTSTLTISNATGSVTFSGNTSSGSGTLALTKAGAGTQIMNGTAANVHSGATTIAGGSLIFASGSTCANSPVTVNSGSGNTLGVQLAAAGAQWACTNLTFGAAAGTYALSIDYSNTTPSTATAPIICSNLAPQSTITLTVKGFPSSFGTPGTYPLIAYNPAGGSPLTSAQFADFSLAALPSGYAGYLTNDTVDKLVSLQITNVPCTETVTMSPSSPLPTGAVDVNYSQTFTGGGGTGPYSFSVVGGNLPGGFNLTTTGLLSGTTTAAGTFSFAVEVADTANGCFNNYFYSLTINPGAIASYAVTAVSPQIQYNPFAVTVTAKDAHGNTVTTNSSTQVTMGSSTVNVQFDGNGNGTFGEVGDKTATLTNGTFNIQAMDNAAESVSITATDGNSKTGTSSSILVNAPANLTWDPGKSPGTGGSDGAGSWTAGTAIWASGGSDVAWIPGANALIGIGGTPGTIKTYAVTVANITFNQTASGGYSLSAGGSPLTFNVGTVTVNNTAAPTIFQKLALAGAVTFTKSGSGMLQLSSCTSTYTGPTVIAGGTLQLLNNTQQLPPTAPMAVAAGATFDMYSKDQIVDALTGSGVVDITAGTGSSSTLTVGYNNGSGTFTGVLQNSGSGKTLNLTKAGTGTQTLNNANTYAGYTTVSSGALALGSSGSINNSPRIILAAGATFDVSALASYAPGNGTTNLYASGTGTAVGNTAAAISGGTTVNLSAVNRIVLTNDASHPSLFISQGTLSLNNNTFYIYNNGLYSVLPDGDYTIIQQASGNISGTVASSVVAGNAVTGKVSTVSIVGGTVMLHVCTLPGAAGAISGPTSVNAGATAVAYSISPVSLATNYTWTVPTGASIATGQGSTAITVNFGCCAVSGSVSVTPVNACGSGASNSLAVAVSPSLSITCLPQTLSPAGTNCFVYLPDLTQAPAAGTPGTTNLDPTVSVNMATKVLPPMGYDLNHNQSNAFPVAYISFEDVHALFTNVGGWQYVLSNVMHTVTQPATFTTNGADITETFESQLTAWAAVTPPAGPTFSGVYIQATGQVTVVVSNYNGGCGDYQTAMTSMSMDGVSAVGTLGTLPFHIAVSSTNVSSGRTIITNCAPGDPTIISGFNVYPVLTVGNDQPMEAEGPVWVQVQPVTGGIQIQSCAPIASVTQDPPPGMVLGLGWYGVTITAVDACGNTNQCFTYVQVADTTPPVITCASNKTIQCGGTWTFDPPSAWDACCGTNVTVWLASSNSTALDSCRTLWQGIWDAMDCNGNVATCTQLVTVVHPQPPSITCLPQTLSPAGTNCFVYLPDLTKAPAAGTPGTTDLDPTVFVNMATKVLPPMGYDLNHNQSNAFPVAYISFEDVHALFTNPGGWQYVLSNVVHTVTQPATFTTNGADITETFESQLTAWAAVTPPGGPTFSDVYIQATGQVTVVVSNYSGGCGDYQTAMTSMSMDGVGAVGSLGTLPFHIAVSSNNVSSGRTIITNCASGDPTIISGFNIYPVLTVGSDPPMEAGGPVWVQVQPVTGGIQIQSCAPIASVTQDPPPGIVLGLGWYPVTITAVDACGNSNQCFTYVHVADTTPPVITCASNKTVQFGGTWTFDPPSAWDACCGTNVTVWLASSNCMMLDSSHTLCQGIWNAKDCNGNVATCTQMVTVVLVQAPTLSGVQLVGPGSVQITFSGPSGQTYKVWKSSDVTLPRARWTVVSTGTFGASPVTYTDSTATGTAGFYYVSSP